ncbi:MAG: hypothetical protein ACK56F_22055 [bacterium]
MLDFRPTGASVAHRYSSFIPGTNTVLLRGPKSREALRHFGPAPGTKGSHAKPYTRAKSHNIESARGR